MSRKSFKTCIHHGYYVDDQNGLLLENEPLCYSYGVAEEAGFPRVSLCGHGGFASQLPNKDYCLNCGHYSKDPDSEKHFQEIGFSPRKKL